MLLRLRIPRVVFEPVLLHGQVLIHALLGPSEGNHRGQVVPVGLIQLSGRLRVQLTVPFHEPKEYDQIILAPADLRLVGVRLVAFHSAAVNIFELLYGRYGFLI